MFAGVPFHRFPAFAAAARCRFGALAFAVLSGALPIRAAESLTARPFAARSGPRGATMFTAVTSEASGIVTENRYADPRMWGERYHEFGVGALGTGVAMGDFDGDGRLDVFVVSKTESSRLFRNLGGWKFEDVTEKAGVADIGAAASEWKQGAAFADVNNDGRLDLYVCRFAAPNLLYMNQGDGTFKEEAAARGLAVTDASSGAAFCDYDRDGWLDVYLQTNLLSAAAHPDGQRDYLFRNRRDGTFENVTDRAGIQGETQGHSATWWDYDGDRWPDLYVANDFALPDVLYRNNRDGTFANVIDRVVPHMPFSGMGADLGDVNNDGRIDLFVADMAATTHQKDQRGMADSRVRGNENRGVAGAPQYQRNALYLAQGTPTVLEAAFLAGLAATDWTWSVRFEDLDNDGRLDLHVTNGMNREQHNSDLLARMMTSESPAARVAAMRSSPILNETNFAFRNRGDLVFESVGAAWGLDQRGVSFGAAWGDLDGDGDLDVVFGNYQAGATVLRNDSDTGHRVTIALRGTTSNRFGIGAFVELESAAGMQVRELVLARGYLSTSEPALHFGLGEVTRIKRLKITWPSGHEQTFADLAVDQRYTITEPSLPAPAVAPSPLPPQGQFTDVSAAIGFSLNVRDEPVDEFAAQPLLPVRLNGRGPALAVGDLNGDGHDEIVIGGTSLEPARLLGVAANGRYAAVSLPGTSVNDGPVLIFDANADGKNDVLITKAGVSFPAGAPEYQPRLFVTGEDGSLRPAAENFLPTLPLSVGAACAADFDRDGRLDLFLGPRVLPQEYPFAAPCVLLANRANGFEDITATVAPGLREAGMVTSALWSDVDGDGWIDLLLTLDWGDVRFWRNDRGRTFKDESESAGFAAAGSGWWTSLAAADFNRDGQLDYAVGNVGLNTQYHASPAEPALLFVVESGDATQLVEAHHEGERVYPWRTRKQLGAQIPAILKRYNRNDSYARSTLGEILGEDRLAGAKRFAATEFRSGVFLSQRNGGHRFVALPRILQISPVQGLAAGDCDGDGHADIYAVQNSYAPAPVVGRFDGGMSQFLRGDGRGGFVAVEPRQSGLIVTGDAKALVVADIDDNAWPDFLVTRNNGTTLAFRNNRDTERSSLRLRLRGSKGNRDGIGARIVVAMADGTEQLAEVWAGSGWLSQSSAACFFGYRTDHPPKQARVRWPSGATTMHDIPAGTTTLALASPSVE